jgi:hypothetical protein
MPELATSAITERITAALDRNTNALLVLATEIAKANGRAQGAIQDWLVEDVIETYRKFGDRLLGVR